MESNIVDILSRYLIQLLNCYDVGDPLPEEFGEIYSKYYGTVYRFCTSNRQYKLPNGEIVRMNDSRDLLPILESAVRKSLNVCNPSTQVMERFKRMLCNTTYTFRYYYKSDEERKIVIDEMISRALTCNL